MSERQDIQLDPQIQSPQGSSRDDTISWVVALETALLPCLPARELQAIDRSPHPSHQIDVERHARDFMEAAEELQLYLLGLQREDQPTKAQMLTQIITMEEELRTKTEIIKNQERLIQGWSKDLSDQLDKHNTELESIICLRLNRPWIQLYRHYICYLCNSSIQLI
ncbi:Mediator of RNA polymerase II transcription subunit 28 [Hibiscus syriacus]|uniref:Mediator of RNA polymerase II transcription subunit 28 n=1 Tax=Hibiscus syriacus TaxID=106335 RepID=A0A6A2WW13_HIBSY|nr:Mediator of RNA polymerase II transcription subunit 28 [Hibiscus syriacus]